MPKQVNKPRSASPIGGRAQPQHAARGTYVIRDSRYIDLALMHFRLAMMSIPYISEFAAFAKTNPLLVAPASILFVASVLTLFFTNHQRNKYRPRLLPGFEPLGLITPLPTFSWRTTPPTKWRPFKPIYNLTMGLQKCTLDDLITIDSNHLDRIVERRLVLEKYGQRKIMDVLGSEHPCSEKAKEGVGELYELLGEWLLIRYPGVFYKERWPWSGGFWKGKGMRSRITDLAVNHSMPDSPSAQRSKIWPATPPDTYTALETILSHLDEDFLVLVPAADNDGYILGSFIAAFPQGFDTSTLLGKRIRDIHAPVPKYKEKLQGSMERYFDRLEVGRFLRRVNWSVTTTERLYTGDVQTHFHEGEEKKEDIFDVNHTFQRSEAQILFRLPKTRALVFVIKTYLYTLQEIKEEGLGPDFADAIEGLGKGNVPEIFTYKRGPVWAEKVKQFLRD